MKATMISKGDPVRVFPTEAWNRIHTLLFNSEADAPGREEMIELYAKMMFHALSTSEAKLIALDKKATMCMKIFNSWRPIIAKLKKVTNHA